MVAGIQAYGDSVTQITPGYVSLMQAHENWTAANHGVASARVNSEGYIDAIFAHSYAPSEVTTSLIGYNDYRDEGTVAGKATNFKDALTAALLFAAVPHSNVIPASAMTLTGTWAATASYGAGTGQQSSSAGDTAAFQTKGSVVYIIGTRIASGGASLKISVDGVDGDTISCNGSNTNREGRDWQPFVLRVAGLTAGDLHTVTATVVGAGTAEVNFGLSNYAYDAGFPTVFAGNGMKMTAHGYAEHSTAGSDAAAALYATKTSDVVTLLAGDGLSVTLVDTITAYDPENNADGIHPDAAGYAQIYEAFRAALAAAGY